MFDDGGKEEIGTIAIADIRYRTLQGPKRLMNEADENHFFLNWDTYLVKEQRVYARDDAQQRRNIPTRAKKIHHMIP